MRVFEEPATVGLANRAIEAGAVAMDSCGREFTADAIGAMMASRELGQLVRQSGGFTSRPKPLSQRERSLFAGKLDEVVDLLRRLAAE